MQAGTWALKQKKKLNDAHSNKAEADKYAEDCKAAMVMTDGITNIAKLSKSILSSLRKHSRRSLNKLIQVIELHGTDYALYNDEQKNLVLRNIKLMQVMKAVIDTPILDKEGNLLGDAEANLVKLQKEMQDKFTSNSTI